MRRLATRGLVLALVWILTPGLTEAAENVWHVALSGHAAHAVEQGPDHAPEGDEHGCSGTFHFCGCHYSPCPTLTSAPAGAKLAANGGRLSAPAFQVQSPPLPGLFRPPRG